MLAAPDESPVAWQELETCLSEAVVELIVVAVMTVVVAVVAVVAVAVVAVVVAVVVVAVSRYFDYIVQHSAFD